MKYAKTDDRPTCFAKTNIIFFVDEIQIDTEHYLHHRPMLCKNKRDFLYLSEYKNEICQNRYLFVLA